MEKIIINGDTTLKGEVAISSAKNSVLPIIAACILCAEECVIEGAPMLEDVFVICSVLQDLGCIVEINNVNNTISINSKNIINKEPNIELVRKMRASFLIMGPMLARFGSFKLSMPGGCNIGNRPIDLHLKGLKALGAKVDTEHGFVLVEGNKLTGCKINLDFPSVGATENIMMAAVFAEGTTIIQNAAEEPEIIDLANFLSSMGAKIFGAGTGSITIHGVTTLHKSVYKPIFDRIEAGTYMACAGITKSKFKLIGVNEEHLRPIISKLTECGMIIESNGEEMIVDGRECYKPVDIKTLPYPGFPTDMQAQMMSLLSMSHGTSVITETVFENRFMQVPELTRMGANIKIDGRVAIIDGVKKLTGCEVKATDLRAGAALVIAGLAATGITTINDVYHIDRGYMNIEKKLKALGADIKRIKI
ncbi:UDP-N-acetylglucosamine 1-carboxyvinyltransferase [Alloiococcus sp. CFN-8]|uniref:UDP-N-acetylglucosamine 1-carboxyvinyltransferase n=1 Tax=Alloiococcus sp. CFN-8 TaxID=3416081 RepID=UPI003CF37031